jgi:hypothetical protein
MSEPSDRDFCEAIAIRLKPYEGGAAQLIAAYREERR